MGNSSGKESRTPPELSPTFPGSGDGHVRFAHNPTTPSGNDRDVTVSESRRETRVEREARKLEKERVARVKERERSIREEHVDGGFLVTLGTYIGPEDFSKPTVRQLMIERRLAPFWKGLDDFSESWTEHQLVAAVRGLPIPAPDEPPTDDLKSDSSPRASQANISHLTVPTTGRSTSTGSAVASGSPSSSNLSSSVPPPSSSLSLASSTPPLFRGRAKTLASLATSRANTNTEITPPEVQLPKDPFVNGQRLEAHLYKDASECPICFLYYPPYLNKTRCCDQPICSECFVQIKRPDPHPPEHADPNNSDAAAPARPEEENQLVSEPSQCPFCVQPEFGVTFEPPAFRRGLAYANQAQSQNHVLASATSAMSSTSSLSSQGLTSPGHSRRRTTSLSANAPQVITTDRIRPDWAKKLSDARAQALRRSAAATALHNAAYMMGGMGDGRPLIFGRRPRRAIFIDPTAAGGSGAAGTQTGTNSANLGALLGALERQNAQRGGDSQRAPEGQSDLPPGRQSSRRNRAEDLEELMMMEAIRLSLAEEEKRKEKAEKEAAKGARKEDKKKAKEAKKVEKAQRNIPRGFHPLNIEGGPSSAQPSASEQPDGKGKAVDRAACVGFNPLSEPTSTLNQPRSKSSTKASDSPSSSQLLSPSFTTTSHSAAADATASASSPDRQLFSSSNHSSSSSSLSDSVANSARLINALGASLASGSSDDQHGHGPSSGPVGAGSTFYTTGHASSSSASSTSDYLIGAGGIRPSSSSNDHATGAENAAAAAASATTTAAGPAVNFGSLDAMVDGEPGPQVDTETSSANNVAGTANDAAQSTSVTGPATTTTTTADSLMTMAMTTTTTAAVDLSAERDEDGNGNGDGNGEGAKHGEDVVRVLDTGQATDTTAASSL